MKKYIIDFRINEQERRYSYERTCPDCVNEENVEAWRRYLNAKIDELMKDETTQTPEFIQTVEQVKEEKRHLEEIYRNWEQQRIMNEEAKQRRSSMERPKITYIPKGLTIDYIQEYGRFLKQEVEFTPTCQDDFLYQRRLIERWYKKSVPQLIVMGRPDAAYGVSMALCKAMPQFIFREDIKEMLDTQKKQIRKLIIGAFEGLVESVKAWNNETERIKVCDFLPTEAERYKEWRGVTKILTSLIPSAAFIGEPLKVTREMNEIELYKDRLRKQEEELRLEAEKEARSFIPLNPDYESQIFNKQNISWNCEWIWHLMLVENKRIERLADQGDYQEAALRFMQMTKSMCRHFVEDEHYTCFDDMYSPEYAIANLIDLFTQLEKAGKLPLETKEYLVKAWHEIKETECYQDYGVPSKELFGS